MEGEEEGEEEDEEDDEEDEGDEEDEEDEEEEEEEEEGIFILTSQHVGLCLYVCFVPCCLLYVHCA